MISGRKGKYKFNKDQLRFTEDRFSVLGFLKRISGELGIIFTLVVIYFVLFFIFFRSDEDRKLIREKRAITAEYDNLIEKNRLINDAVENIVTRDIKIYQELFNAAPPSILVKRDTNLSYTENEQFIFELIMFSNKRLKTIYDEASSNSAILNNLRSWLQDQADVATTTPSIIPVEDFTLAQTGATTGNKIHPFYKTMVMHNGLDIITAEDTHVLATADAVVESVVRQGVTAGNYIVLNHGNGYKTQYSHLKNILVKKGEKVSRGKIIGSVGNTGISFIPHLHYEIVFNGKYMNPVNYFFGELDAENYNKMLIIAANSGQSMD